MTGENKPPAGQPAASATQGGPGQPTPQDFSTPRGAAAALIGCGFHVLRIPPGSKAPANSGWLDRNYGPEDFGPNDNVGLKTGKGLACIDIDWPEAQAAAGLVLPATAMADSRGGPPGHLFYRVTGDLPTRTFDAPREAVPAGRGGRILEVLGAGRQVNVPPSVHPETGRRRFWCDISGRPLPAPGEPAEVDPADLLQAAARLAAAALLAAQWRPGQRQDLALALAGWLLRGGWDEGEVAAFIGAICEAAGDEETRERIQTGEYTRRRLEENRPTTGGRRLRELLGQAVVDRLADWLGLRRGHGDEEPVRAGPYFVAGGSIYWEKPTREGSVPVQLSNFVATIVASVILDDGVEQSRVLEIEAVLGRVRQSGRIPASKFASLTWVLELLGPKAVIAPGQAPRDHLRAAIQLLSPDPLERRVFTYTGWRVVGGRWLFLHAGGALGPEGPVPGVEVELPDELRLLNLPEPPRGEALAQAVRAVLHLLDLAPPRIMAPLVAAPFTAPLLDCDFSLHLAGPTGVFKTELATLMQQFFGPGFDARHLPASWAATSNALEDLAFRAKDVVLVVDDFAPTGPAWVVAQLHREADRLLRAAGNRLGRLRMRPDTTLRPARPPRGLIISTGEDIPRGQSLRARLWVIEVSPGDVSAEALTRAQAGAAAGVFAGAEAAYIAWLAARLEDCRGEARTEALCLRDAARRAPHPRTPDIAGKLGAGLRMFLQFAAEVGALTTAEGDDVFRRVWGGLLEGMAAQVAAQEAAEPVRRFIELVSSAVASGAAHLANPDGEEPADPQAWGWRKYTIGAGENIREEWRPQGHRIGWVDGQDVYLDPDAALRAAQEVARASGDGLAISTRTLGKRLREAGLLLAVDLQGHNTCRKQVEGRRARVWALPAKIFLDVYSTPGPVQSGHPTPNRAVEEVVEEW